jgi:hypothetical protein
MSVSGILSSAAFGIGAQLLQSRMQKVKSEFQQLGTDLQYGNLSAAQADFATLQQLKSQGSSNSSTQGANPAAQDFNQLATDLKAGNTTAAQQDFTNLQKDLQTQPPTIRHHHHHSSSGDNQIGQMISQLSQALQSGNLSTAQKAYATLQQDLQQYAQSNTLPTLSATTGISVDN